MTGPGWSRPGDEAELKALWKQVFGDSDAIINCFFTTVYTPGCCAVYRDKGRIVSAAYKLPLGVFLPTGEDVNLVYAVATLPAHRSRGYGAVLVNLAAESGLCLLCPGEESLYGYYQRICGGRTDFFSLTFSGAALPGGSVARIDANRYLALREDLLRGTPHTALNSAMCTYLQNLCALSGGGLYALRENGIVTAVAAVEIENGTALIKELLGKESSAPYFAHHCGCGTFTARAPGSKEPDGMVCNGGKTLRFPRNSYIGPRFD